MIKDICSNNDLTFTYTEQIHKHRELQHFGKNAGSIKLQHIPETLEYMLKNFH